MRTSLSTVKATILIALSLTLGLIFALPASAAKSLRYVPNFDGTLTSAFPLGNKPQGGTCPPATWTALSLGDGDGEICDAGLNEYTLSVSGGTQPANYQIIYKDAGAGEVQIEGRVLDSYVGPSSDFANAGVAIREGTAATDYVFQMHSLQNGATAVQCQFGENGSHTTVNGASGFTRPRYIAVTRNPVTGHNRGFESTDGSSWSEVCSDIETMSDVLAQIGGTSRSTNETLSASIDNIALLTEIDAYDESTDGGAGGPTLVAAIENQSSEQGTAVSLSCAANFSGVTAGYTQDGLPSGTGITFNTSNCSFAGTPDADDAAASPFNVEVCASNGIETCDTFQWSVAPIPGQVFTIPTATNNDRTFDCSSDAGADDSVGGAGTWTEIADTGSGPPGPGDHIVLAAGIHSGPLTPLRIQNCVGSSGSPIVIRNDNTASEPAVVRRIGTGTQNYVFLLRNNRFVTITGEFKYVGADSEVGGVDPTNPFIVRRGNRFGIIVDGDNDAGSPSGWFKIDRLSRNITVRSIKVDATANLARTRGSCFDWNDHGELAADNPTFWFENILWEHNWGLGCGGTSGGEGFYIGSNLNQLDIPVRHIVLQYNVVDNSARDCFNVKNVTGGSNTTNVIQYNYGVGCGQTEEDAQNGGIALLIEAPMTLRGNQFYRTNGVGIKAFVQDRSSPQSNGTAGEIIIENNIIGEPGRFAGSINRDGIFINRNSGAEALTVNVRNNTVATSPHDGVACASSSVSGTVANNILVGISGVAVSGTNCTTNSNRTGTVATQNFTDSANDDYTLTSTSPACGAGNPALDPSIDIEGETRSATTPDQGADESTSCP